MANRLTVEQQHNQEEKKIKDLLGECVMKLRALRPGCARFLDHGHNYSSETLWAIHSQKNSYGKSAFR